MKPTNTSPAEDDDQDLEDWIRSLHSHAQPASSQDSHDPKALRHAILAHHRRHHHALLADALSDDHAWQRMQFRLKRSRGTGWKKTGWWVPTAMAAALVMALTVPLMSHHSVAVIDGPPVALRGASAAPIVVASPLKLAQAIARDMRALDPHIKLHWHQATATLDMSLEGHQLEAAEAVLTKHLPQTPLRLNMGQNRLVLIAPGAASGR